VVERGPEKAGVVSSILTLGIFYRDRSLLLNLIDYKGLGM
jgi:hypothetical protein